MQCPDCDKEFETEYLLEIHRVNVHCDLKHKCLLCENKYKDIHQHLRKNHPDKYINKNEEKHKLYTSPKTNCKFCDYEGTSLLLLIKHIKQRHIISSKKCEKCDKIVGASYMKIHILKYHSEDTHEWNCEICVRKFENKLAYQQHLKTKLHIDTKKLFIWNEEHDIKPKQIESKKKLESKSSNKIEICKEFKCNLCDLLFNSFIDLKEHSFNHITDLKCCICEKIFSNENTLFRHFNCHNPDRDIYKCEMCDSTFKRNDGLVRHIKDVHEKERYIICKYCDQPVLKRTYNERHKKNCEMKIFLHKYPGSSSWERMVSQILIENKIQFICQYKRDDLRSLKNNCLPFDFYIPSLDVVIEVHGSQHYKKTRYSNAEEIFERTQRHDKIKEEYAKTHFKDFIVINTMVYNSYAKIKEFLEN